MVDIKKLIKDTEEEIEVKLSEIEKLQKTLNEYYEKIMEDDDNFVKIYCIVCNGDGWIQQENKKTICPTCKGKQYMWGRKYP